MLSSSTSPLLQLPLKSSSTLSHRNNFRPLVICNSATVCKEWLNLSFTSPKMATRISSLYELLGIPMGASNQEIKSAFRQLARTCHPDVASLDRKDTSASEFMKIHKAYSTLSDPETRAAYDSKLFSRNRSLTVNYSGYRGQSWETDQCW